MSLPLTTEQRASVRQFTFVGMKQKQIAATLGVSRHLVRKAQREAGMPPHDCRPLSIAMQAKILELARNFGYGAPRISRELGVARHRATTVLKENGLRRKLTTLQARAIRREYRNFEAAMAVKHHTTVGAVARLLRRRKPDD